MSCSKPGSMKECSAIEVINDFGTSLVDCHDFQAVAALTGNAVHSLIPRALLNVSRLSPDGSHMTIVWQYGFDLYLNAIKGILRADPFQMEFSIAGGTPEELALNRSGKLYRFDEGLYTFAIRAIPKIVCRTLEVLLNIGDFYAIGFAWNGSHYGGLGIMLPRGVSLENSDAIETIVHLASVGMQRVHAQENIIRLQKLEALGIFAGGIAHDFNNLFMGIFGYIECAKMETGKNVHAYLDKALNTMGKARELTSQLITFSVGGAPALQKAPLFPFAEEVLKSAVKGSSVSYTIENCFDLQPCFYDRDQLRPILQGIVQNALEAMPGGGNMRFSARNFNASGNNHASLSGGAYVKLSISDEGIGIPEQDIPKIFTPFYSTKSMGKGINLAIAWSVLKRHGGTIEVESKAGKGTTFHLYLKADNVDYGIQ